MNANQRPWIYAGLGLAAGVGLVMVTKPSTAAPEALGDPFPSSRILLLGDSLAQGLAPPLQQLAGELTVEAHLGSRIDSWMTQPWLVHALTKAKPTVILVSLGTNDMKAPGDPTKPLERFIEILRASKASIVWIAPPSMPFFDRGVRAAIEHSGLLVFKSDSLRIPRGPDHVHPTALGYAGWAGALWSWLGRPHSPVVLSSARRRR